jgi:hypothetical protein
MNSTNTDNFTIVLGDIPFAASRPHRFGLVINGPVHAEGTTVSADYLHEILLAPANRDGLLTLIEKEGLVVCKNVRSDAPTYRRVRGKSSFAKLSQAEYYHHDGCSSPTKPRVVEIRCPYQDVSRNVATAIAPFPDVIRAMLEALPEGMLNHEGMRDYREAFTKSPSSKVPPTDEWDAIQGKVTRLVRKEMDAEACRAYFRSVDELAGAYAFPWEMGESRLMLNSSDDLAQTMQHRRAYQKPRGLAEQNGSLVKRWTAEEA